MAPDVVDLRGFYATPLGETARQLIARRVQGWWTNCAGLSLMGLGYATPYLEPFRANALRALAFMPAEQGVVNWPTSGLSAAALVETTSLPLPDASIDRALVAHALETAEHPGALLEEIWRVLTPGGRMILVCPSRSGVWARVDATPFGHGQPWSRGQLRDLMRQSLFSPEHWAEALYMPPVTGRTFLRSAFAFEAIGAKLSLPGAGVHVVEATKQLYRPVGARRMARRALPSLQPALTPAGVSPSARTTTRQETNG